MIEALEQFAPLPLQESWDNAGLQVGLTSAEASGALLCLDVTEQVVAEAIRKGCNIIVSHHPLLFHPLKRVSGNSMVERIVMQAIKHGITIVSMHTNMDNAQGGVNFHIAKRLGLHDVEFISPRTTDGIENGSLIHGFLTKEMPAELFVRQVKEQFCAKCAMTNGLREKPISSVAICGGAGGSFLGDAIEAGADAFLTGEMHYHEYFDHTEIQIIVIGHFETEQYTSEIFRDILSEKCPTVPTFITETLTNPIMYV